MPVNAIVQEKLLDFEQEGIPQVFERDLSLGDVQSPARGNLVNVVVGTRRCGKTYRLYQEMRAILDAGYPRSSLMYFNFEDERLKPYSPGLLADVLDTFFAMHPDAKRDGAFLFFDEIQEVDDWGAFLRRVVDGTKATVYVTGASSKMLSAELSSEFRGRALSREMFPLSFSEFARFRGVTGVPFGDGFSSSAQADLRHACVEYLNRGGFIAPLRLSPSEGMLLLQEYAYRTVALDVVERYGLRNPRVASMFVARCLASSGRELSVNKVYGDIRSRGVSVSRETLGNLLAYYEDAFLVFPVGELSRAIADNPRSVSKIYAVDPGMFAAFAPASTVDAGQRLETAVYDKLRRGATYARKGAVSRLFVEDGGSRHEVDFVVGDAMLMDAYRLVQVSVDMADAKTRSRELSALDSAMRRYGISESTVVTMDEESDEHVSSGTIHIVPAWKWLLDGGDAS
ncbi:ATPase (AAA+ superfamily) [Bifidobacterium lemurum]|uniref:ATPase (AAA+ superfamily) n=2 Tax=Bifidobacterium lemurum TaxID=1603886 RepID=A0A261FLQ8_9BIFI|nr:ATP-binding protein [Bifidobacterium lemurum]OZG59925.1 ATPase (AAA+ superfamily) [Bifidobacterium lemurum]QOL35486.1 ATP-binding protein [Bifidobacterium lemurum]